MLIDMLIWVLLVEGMNRGIRVRLFFARKGLHLRVILHRGGSFGSRLLCRDAGGLDGFNVVVGATPRFGFLFREQRHAIGNRDLIVIRMDFCKSQKPLPVASIFHKRSLQRRLDARHLGEIDVSLEGPLGRGLEIKLFDFLSVENDNPGFFPVAGIDNHALWHSNLQATASHASGSKPSGQCRSSMGTPVALNVDPRDLAPAEVPLDEMISAGLCKSSQFTSRSCGARGL